jgi:hypothetical protein
MTISQGCRALSREGNGRMSALNREGNGRMSALSREGNGRMKARGWTSLTTW